MSAEQLPTIRMGCWAVPIGAMYNNTLAATITDINRIVRIFIVDLRVKLVQGQGTWAKGQENILLAPCYLPPDPQKQKTLRQTRLG